MLQKKLFFSTIFLILPSRADYFDGSLNVTTFVSTQNVKGVYYLSGCAGEDKVTIRIERDMQKSCQLMVTVRKKKVYHSSGR
ncbi:hypothetical protein DSUL_50182 [Desulfovibrionales bacterium]